MTRRFLFILFDSFVLLVVFISLFQFSAANLNLGGLESRFSNDNYFGFYSLFTFSSDLGNNTEILQAWDDGVNWFTQVMTWMIDNIQDSWNNIADLSNNYFERIVQGLRFLFLILTFPVAFVIGFGGIIIFVVRFIWILVSMLFRLLLGYYNSPITRFTSESVSESIRFVNFCFLL